MSWPGMPLDWQMETFREWRKATGLPPRVADWVGGALARAVAHEEDGLRQLARVLDDIGRF